jgi:HlyD family secretion protein
MDKPRSRDDSRRWRSYLIAIAAVALVGITIAVGRLEPAMPTVDRATLAIDSVQRGTMVRQVRAPGILIPERIRWVSAVTAGRVERLPVRPGAAVTHDEVLVELTNPDVQLEALDAERQFAAARADLVRLRSQLENDRLTQQAALATARTALAEADRDAATMTALDAKRLSSRFEVARASERASELRLRRDIEERRLVLATHTAQLQLQLQEAQVQRIRAIRDFHIQRVASMRVAAGDDGIVQELPLELGQWVVPGQLLAKVAEPGRLKAQLRVPETQAKDVSLGQRVSIDTRSGGANSTVGLLPGHVIRIDPASQNGAVLVEVALDLPSGALPRGLRAESSVDGTIELERLSDVLHLTRPAYGQSQSTVGVFRVDSDGRSARRVSVRFGRASVNSIEILAGLAAGDKVIVSDVSQWDSTDRIKIQ